MSTASRPAEQDLIYPFQEKPPAGQVLEVASGVFWVRMSLPFQLDHINLWLLRDEDGWVMVDTGFADQATEDAWRQILGQLDGPVRRLLVTHFHPDHFGLAAWLQRETGAELWMSTSEFLTAHAVWSGLAGHAAADLVAQFRQHGLSEALLEKFAVRGSGYRRSVPALPNCYQRLKAGDFFTVDGKKWKIIIGLGHSPEHVALYCAERDVLISGDMLLPRISTNISVYAAMPKADALQWFLDALQVMKQEIPSTALVLPSHGLPFKGIPQRVAALVDHHRERLDALENSCHEAPKSAAELLGVLFPRPLDTHQIMFAMGEAIAHLNHLEQAGRLLGRQGTDGVVRYSSAKRAF